MLKNVYGGLNVQKCFSEGLNARKCIWRLKCSKMYMKAEMLFPKCIYPKCIFAKCTRLACLLSFTSLFSFHPGQSWTIMCKDLASFKLSYPGHPWWCGGGFSLLWCFFSFWLLAIGQSWCVCTTPLFFLPPAQVSPILSAQVMDRNQITASL